jgi:tRNA A37 threonylcarbamoyladenosine dehydratase
MMFHSFSRTELLIGKENLDKLKVSTVAVFGVGGVGSYTVEALARCGIGKLVIVDNDTICITNINRQLIATRKTLGKPKVEIMKERILDINPDAEVLAYKEFYCADNSEKLLSQDYDYIVDAIDTVSSKIDLITKAKDMDIRIISCMGAGNKLEPTKFEVADIYETSVCPLAKVMRHELKKRGVESLKVVYSKEKPLKPFYEIDINEENYSSISNKKTSTEKNHIPGSISFVPSVAGLILAGEVIKDLIGCRTYLSHERMKA